MGRGVLRACLLLWTLLLASAPAHLTSSPADALIPPSGTPFTVTVSFSQDTIVANVSHFQSVVVMFYGNVTVDGLDEGMKWNTTVLMEVECSFYTVFNAQSSIYGPNGTWPFFGDILVPFYAHTGPYSVTVSAEATFENHTERGSARFTLMVGQYFEVDSSGVSIEHTIVEVSKSPTTVKGVVYIRNSGNGNDTFLIEIVDPPDELEDYSMSGQVVVDMNRTADVPYALSLDFKSGLKQKVIFVTFKVSSLGALNQSAGGDVENWAKVEYEISIIFRSPIDRLIDNTPLCAGLGIVLVAICMVVITRVWLRRRERKGRVKDRSTQKNAPLQSPDIPSDMGRKA